MLEGKKSCCSATDINKAAEFIKEYKNKMSEKAKKKDKKMKEVGDK